MLLLWKDYEVCSDGCARLLEVAQGLCMLLSLPLGTPIIGGAISPGIIHSKMFGVLIDRKKNIYVNWLARPMLAQSFYDYGTWYDHFKKTCKVLLGLGGGMTADKVPDVQVSLWSPPNWILWYLRWEDNFHIKGELWYFVSQFMRVTVLFYKHIAKKNLLRA